MDNIEYEDVQLYPDNVQLLADYCIQGLNELIHRHEFENWTADSAIDCYLSHVAITNDTRNAVADILQQFLDNLERSQ